MPTLRENSPYVSDIFPYTSTLKPSNFPQKNLKYSRFFNLPPFPVSYSLFPILPTMQTQSRPATANLDRTIAAAQTALLSQQTPDGYWWADLESNVTITAEVVLLHKIWGTDTTHPLRKVETYLRREQRDHGGWELFYGDGGELSTTVEAYMALRLLGVPATDPALQRAKTFILARGGISKTRIFTKFHLALIGCYDWSGLPALPAWVMLLPSTFPFTIYEMSSWARSSTVPLLIVFDRKPVYTTDPDISLDELYSEGIDNVRYDLPRAGNWADIFLTIDSGFKWMEKLNWVPFRKQGIRAAEKWILERQEATGDWGGIIPAMLNSMLALRVLDYDVSDPIVQRGFEALNRFGVEATETYWTQPCVSPLWDTALAARALVASGLEPDHPALVQAGQWLLDRQILDYGDWAVKNRQGKPGAWAFEFDNRFYPDLDDSAVIVMALYDLKLPNEAGKQAAMSRAADWIATMQCRDGGWGAFDIDNNQDWLNDLPYGDLKAMIDPNTADVTARVLEMVGHCLLQSHPAFTAQRLQRALAYLYKEQEPEGCWYGRWGVNYIYGTSGVLKALSVVDTDRHRHRIEQGAAWLVTVQNPDGGWGESCRSYNDPTLKGQGPSTASQTAWALIGLLAAGEATGTFARDACDRGIQYLIKTQQPDGTWEELEFTGTGFPCHFYLRYLLYPLHFPLVALGRYRELLG